MNSTDAGRQLIYTSRSYQSGNADARAKRMRRAPEATAASETSCVRQVQQYGHGGLGGVGGGPPVSVAAVTARRVDHLQFLKVEFGNR